MPYLPAQLGDAAADESVAVAREHAAFARAHGWVATRMPPGVAGAEAFAGQLAYRTTTAPPHRYVLAAFSLRQRDAAVNGALVAAVRAGRRAEAATAILAVPAAIGSAVLDVPRVALAQALGIPKWAGSALLVGGAALALYAFTSSAGGGLGALIPRRNPPRRRRRRAARRHGGRYGRS